MQNFNNINVEQILSVQKSNADAFFGLASKAFEGVERLTELNLQAAKATLGESAEYTRALLGVKTPEDLQSLQSTVLSQAPEKFSAYSRQVSEIVAATQGEFTRAAEAKIATAQQEFLTAVETLGKNAPAGSENMVALLKNAVSTTNGAFESVSKAAKQATDAAQANLQALTNTAVAAATKRRAA